MAIDRSGRKASRHCRSCGGAHLRALRLNRATVGNSGALELAQSPHLGKLRVLELRNNNISDAGVAGGEAHGRELAQAYDVRVVVDEAGRLLPADLFARLLDLAGDEPVK